MPFQFAKKGLIGLLSCRIQDQPHRSGERFPFRVLGGKLFPPGGRQLVKFGPLSFVRYLPGGSDPSLSLQPVERRVKRAGLYLQQILGGSLNVFRDRVPVLRSGPQSLQNKEIKRALQHFHAYQFLAHCVDILLYDL